MLAFASCLVVTIVSTVVWVGVGVDVLTGVETNALELLAWSIAVVVLVFCCLILWGVRKHGDN